MSEYVADDRPITEPEFTRRACDPHASVVIEACAGSGKTWLLVSRIVRLLLAGADPSTILAITFTRRAAQEMRARLLHDLKQLARCDEPAIVDYLQQRGMAPEAARAAVDPARRLYERVVTASVPLTIETFHGWFWRLLSRAPLGAGVPFAPLLLETSDRLRADAWLQFTAALMRPRHSAEREAWEWMIDDIGDFSAKTLLLEFLRKRAEWWAFAADGEDAAIARALHPLRAAGEQDPGGRLRDPVFLQALQTLLALWRSTGTAGSTLNFAIESAQRWLSESYSRPAGDLQAVCNIVLTKELEPRVGLLPASFGRKLAPPALQSYSDAHALVIDRLQHLIAARRIWRALKLNEAGLCCGRLLIDIYQRLKEQQQALDFTDLEWHTHRLLADPDQAAYMQARLDARYGHILLDEFQDTNPLQWQVLQSWLAAYGPLDEADGTGARATADRPSVFIVGDPKQSIYRFRSAEPLIFDAARRMMAEHFAAAQLRTNVTRRNPRTVIDVLNRAMAGRNPLFQEQSTRTAGAGTFVLVPLMQPDPPVRADQNAALRDVLTTARSDSDNRTRYREGRVLANEIAHWLARTNVSVAGGQRPAQWSDALVLVRSRTHLPEYERALRDAAIPFVSDRRGGLLATLEAHDLTALLEFLTAHFADLKLAHALRSPIFGCSDDDLIRLAIAPGESWWERLQALGETAPTALARARKMLQRWIDLAGVLPVHDLLDRIYFEGDVRRRYAAVVPAALHAQVQANLDAFIELALAIDAGRYPSLPRFVDELADLREHAVDEAPDEGACQQADAVRIMTIHGAKGLEAEIVVLADAHTRSAPEGESVLVVWPPQAAAPEHVSLVARGAAAKDSARGLWFGQDELQRAQEDWNLLYVAATRARQVLIVSGSAPAKVMLDDTWYTRLQCAEGLSSGAAPAEPLRSAPLTRFVRDFLPEPMPTGARVVAMDETEAMRIGRAWHALLEAGGVLSIDAIAREHGLTPEQAREVQAAAARVRAALPHLFEAGSAPELELVAADGQLLRVDRLIELDEALWIVDFKWRVTDNEKSQYETQVRRYAEVLGSIRTDKPVRMGLVTAAGVLTEVSLADLRNDADDALHEA